MSTGRSAAYLLRRLGREFLIWGGLALVLFLIADQYYLWRSQQQLAKWTTQYAELIAEDVAAAEACPAQARLVTAYRQDAANREERKNFKSQVGISWPSHYDYPALDEFSDTIFSLDGDGIGTSNYPFLRPVQLDAAGIVEIDTWLDLLTAVGRCDTLVFGDKEVDPTYEEYGQFYALLVSSLYRSMQLTENPDATRCTEILLRVGQLVPKTHHPEPTYRFSQQITLGRHWLAAVHYARINGGLLPEATDEIIEVLADIHDAQAHPLSAQDPRAFQWEVITSRMKPWQVRMQRALRPYINYRIALIAENNLGLSEAVTLPHRADRAAIYHDVWATGQPAIEAGGSHLRGVIRGIEEYELFLTECETLALMLTLEAYHRTNGHHPDKLSPLEDFIPPGFDKTEYLDSALEYGAKDGGSRYVIIRKVFRHEVTPTEPAQGYSIYHRIWRHQHETAQ